MRIAIFTALAALSFASPAQAQVGVNGLNILPAGWPLPPFNHCIAFGQALHPLDQCDHDLLVALCRQAIPCRVRQ
jgi:hypothetical protein